MLNIKNFNLIQAFLRFPVASILAILATSLLMYSLDKPHPSSHIISLILTAIIGAVSNIAWSISHYSYNWSQTKLWIGRFIILLSLVIFYLTCLPESYEVHTTALFRLPIWYGCILIFLHLLIAYIPFISQGGEEDFWEYNKDVLLTLVEAAFYAFSLFLGLSIALVSLDKLFGIEIDSLAYPRLFIFLIGTFQTLYFLSNFPTVTYDNTIKKPIKAFLIFSQYILIPLVLLYMIILYAYAGKIGFRWELPKGWVSQLSLWFSVVGIFAYLLNYFNYKFSDNRLTTFFKKYFFPILLLPIALIFVAIYRRVSEYGVTELRYIVSLLGVWLLCVSVYFIISKKRSLKVIPMSLSVFSLLPILLGPFNIFNSTLSSQQKNLRKQLIDKKLLVDKELKSFPDTISADNSISIDSIKHFSREINNKIKFLDKRSDLSFINNWINNEVPLIKEKDPTVLTDALHRYHNTELLKERLNLFKTKRDNIYNNRVRYFRWSYDNKKAVKIDNNKFFVPFNSSKTNSESQNRLIFNPTEQSIFYYNGNKKLAEINLNNYLKSLSKHSTTKINYSDLNMQNPIYQYENEKLSASLIFDYINGSEKEDGQMVIRQIRGWGIIDIK